MGTNFLSHKKGPPIWAALAFNIMWFSYLLMTTFLIVVCRPDCTFMMYIPADQLPESIVVTLPLALMVLITLPSKDVMVILASFAELTLKLPDAGFG